MPLDQLLRERRFVHLAEARPPKGVNTVAFVANIGKLQGRVDAVVVPDAADAVMTMDARTGARLALAAGVEAVLQVNCRDRNRLALQGEMLGAWVDGVRAVAVEAGVDPAAGDHPGAKGVYDLDAERLLAAIRGLGTGVDMAGATLDGAPRFLVGADVDPWDPAAAVPEADFMLTRTAYDAETLEPVLPNIAALGKPAIVRVTLLKSGGMARYIQRNVSPGRLSDRTVERLQRAPDKTEAAVEIAAEVIRRVRLVAAGVCIVPLGWEARIPAVLDAAR
ncbi:MAG: methylenetetrahydrofolate reductase [Myxococcota bacterium]|nr:methylenetetrahydrofolate reductase [Myxococcota bacterium]